MNVVIIGLGYVGLPLAQEAVRVGLNVTGLDIRQATVDGLNAGRSHVDDLSDADVAAMVAGGFRATTDVAGVGAAAGRHRHLRAHPAERVRRPRPDRGQGRHRDRREAAQAGRAHRPRVDDLPGHHRRDRPPDAGEGERPDRRASTSTWRSPRSASTRATSSYGIRNTPKVVGGLTPACTDAAAAFYGTVCDTVVKAKSAREAEMAKLLENTYRHVNIALVNEMAIFCHELGVDLWDAIRCAATKPFGFQAFYPGPGVGGHCIPIDPNYLSYKVRAELKHPFRFVELAQEINSRMPGYVVDRAAELLNTDAKPLNGAKVLLLGVTYKKDIADQRESPARPIARKLLQRGAVLSYHDPFVDAWQVDGKDIRRAAVAGRAGRPDDPAPGALRVRPGPPSPRTPTCCSTPVARFPETRSTRCSLPGDDPPYPRGCRRRQGCTSSSARSCITRPTPGSSTARSRPCSTPATTSRTSPRTSESAQHPVRG